MYIVTSLYVELSSALSDVTVSLHWIRSRDAECTVYCVLSALIDLIWFDLIW